MSSNRRDMDRFNVQVVAKLREGPGRPHAVLVTNLSATGCRFSSTQKFAIGSRISIHVGRAEPVEGRVKWRVAGMHGVRFAKPLSAAIFDHIRLFLSAQPSLVAERSDEADAA